MPPPYDDLLQIDDERIRFGGCRKGEFIVGRLASDTTQFSFRTRVVGGAMIMDTEDTNRVVFWCGIA